MQQNFRQTAHDGEGKRGGGKVAKAVRGWAWQPTKTDASCLRSVVGVRPCVGVAASTSTICHVNKSSWRKKQLKNKTQLQIVQGYTQLEHKYQVECECEYKSQSSPHLLTDIFRRVCSVLPALGKFQRKRCQLGNRTGQIAGVGDGDASASCETIPKQFRFV